MVHFTGLMSSVFPLIFWNKWQLNYIPWWHREKIRSHCNRPGSWNWWRLLITSSSYCWFISAASKIFTKLKFLLASPQSCLYLHLYNFVCYHVCTLLSVCGCVLGILLSCVQILPAFGSQYSANHCAEWRSQTLGLFYYICWWKDLN